MHEAMEMGGLDALLELATVEKLWQIAEGGRWIVAMNYVFFIRG